MFKSNKEVGNYCPLIKKNCIEGKCSWWMHVRGMDPQTGEDIDHWGCAVTWVPMLTIENSQQQRQTGAAVESFRNEVVKSNNLNRDLYMEGLKACLTEAYPSRSGYIIDQSKPFRRKTYGGIEK